MMSRFRAGPCRSVIAGVLLALVFTALHAAYVVEWTAPLQHYYAYGYTANRDYTYDLTGDSIPELFVTDSIWLKVYSGVTRGLIWTLTAPYYGSMSFNLANTDGDAAKELVLSAFRYSPDFRGRFYVYDCQSRALEYTSPEKTGYPYISVADVDGDGKSEICFISGPGGNRILEVYGSDALDAEEPPAVPEAREYGSAVPNPARPGVALTIPIAPGSDRVTITDITGRPLRVIPTGGSSAVIWDGCEDGGIPAPAGTYLYRSGPAAGRVQLIR